MKKLTRIIKPRLALLALSWLVATTALNLMPVAAKAAVANPAPAAKISFTFDDGYSDLYTQAAPTLAAYGLSGTSYVITNCVGMTKAPNTCAANTDATYMTWAQIQALQNTYGWEIGSHTLDHKCLASNATVDPDDCQANTLTAAQVAQELAGSQSALAAQGIKATDFAPPYGDYNNSVLTQIAKYYATMRSFQNATDNPNVWPYSDYLLQDYVIQEKTTPVATVEAEINKAITNKSWLILTFHDIKAKPSKVPDDYEYGTSELAQIAAYVKSKQTAGLVQSVHVNQGTLTSDTNLLPNGSFNDGIADGWSTDKPAGVVADSGNNGSYPDPAKSIKFTNASGASHLFSPKVAVNPNTTYALKNFLNVQAISSGVVGFYIDEYDANGNWISGQWRGGESSAFVENMNFTYKPSSANVVKASLQVVASGTGITAYLDNTQWFPLSTVTPPVQTNLVANGSFDAGISQGWRTDDAVNITADAGNNGSPNNPVNSVKLASNTSNTHLFSPLVPVSAKPYTITTYLNLKSLSSGGVAFYIDEYDATGNWVSGQYKTEIYTPGAEDISLSYTPSSGNVASASLQIIVIGNSNLLAYVDDVRWYAN